MYDKLSQVSHLTGSMTNMTQGLIWFRMSSRGKLECNRLSKGMKQEESC